MEKLTLEATVKELEMANFIIERAIVSLSENKEILKEFNMTKSDIELLKSFRNKITKTILA